MNEEDKMTYKNVLTIAIVSLAIVFGLLILRIGYILTEILHQLLSSLV